MGGLAFGILLIAFALRVYRLAAQSIWWDEGHSIEMASAALTQIPTLPGMDVHPPGYFVLLHQWMGVAGRSEYGLRYLSVVFSMLTVALLIRFGWRLAGRQVGGLRLEVALAAGGLAALSPLYVAYAQEVRMYAMVTLLALASTYFQWRVLEGWKVGRLEDWRTGRIGNQPSSLPAFQPSNLPVLQSSPWSVAGYVLTTAASLYTHYFTVFLLLFQNLAWLVGTVSPRAAGGVRPRRLGVWLGTQLAILALFLPQLPLALWQTTAYANPNLNPPGVREFVTRAWLAYTVGTAVDPEVGKWLAGGLAVIVGLAVVFQTVKARRRPDQRMGTTGFLVAWFLVPLAVYFLVLQRRPSFEPRYMMMVTPALVLLVVWGLARRPEARPGCAVRAGVAGAKGEGRQRGWGRLGLLAALAVFGIGTWAYFTNVVSYKDDSAGVANWLAAETTSNDVVYVDVPHPFHYYAERIPAPTRYLFVDVHTAADVLNTEAAGRDRLFWVTWRGSDTDPRGVIPFLLDKAGRREGELDWRGYHVTWWELPGDTRFSLPDELLPGDMTFGDVIRLDGWAFSPEAQAGEAVWATLHFTLLRDADADYRISLRLRDSAGNMLPPTDKDLLNDRHMRTSAWPLGDAHLNQAINVYTLPVPPEADPGEYCLEVVVYEATMLDALPATGALLSGPGCASAEGDGISARLGNIVVASPVQNMP